MSDIAIAKQLAWAAPSSSSGFVPLPSSKRELNEYALLNAPFPKSTCPLPSLMLPSHRACALRVAMTASFPITNLRRSTTTPFRRRRDRPGNRHLDHTHGPRRRKPERQQGQHRG